MHQEDVALADQVEHRGARVDERRALGLPFLVAQLVVAGEKGDWLEALRHYDEVLEILPDDSPMLFARGLIHSRLDQPGAAAADIKQALEGATLRSDIDRYQQALDALRRDRVAAL